MFKSWHMYVDDIFAVIPNRHIQDALKLLNIQDNSLKFTLETEIDGQLPFLDLKITRNSNRLTSYQKLKRSYYGTFLSTWSNRLTFGMYKKPTHTECCHGLTIRKRSLKVLPVYSTK